VGSGFSKMKKQKRQVAERFAKLREAIQQATYKGSAGSGLVEVILDGEKSLKSIVIQSECVDSSDVEGLQDLIVEAFRQAESQIETSSFSGSDEVTFLKDF